MSTATDDRTYRCFLDGGAAHGLIVPDVGAPAPAVIECERRDWPGWVLVYGQAVVDDDQGVARYRFVAAGPRPNTVAEAAPSTPTYG